MSHRGFTLVEVVGAVFVVGLLCAVTIPAMADHIEEARLARCQADLKALQAEVWNWTTDGQVHPDATTFWNLAHDGIKPGPFVYLVDGDPNKGHGNDIDGVDEENPGNSKPDREDIRFVIYCKHNHHGLADYVYVVDAGKPKVVAGPDDDPGYRKFEKFEFK
jgi:type II secretory pathway pseudopilin PulG